MTTPIESRHRKYRRCAGTISAWVVRVLTYPAKSVALTWGRLSSLKVIQLSLLTLSHIPLLLLIDSGTSTISERAWWSSRSVESTPKFDTGLPSGYSPVLAYFVIRSCLRKGNHIHHNFIVIRNADYYNTSSVANIKFSYKLRIT